jgi:C4-dicarboxylate transporter DctM subunit
MSSARLTKNTVRTEPRATFAEALAALRRSFWALTLPWLVLGGMYFGVFTATEAATAGALAALLIAMLRVLCRGETRIQPPVSAT